MDDKTFVAKYATDEMVRINKRLKEMIEAVEPPSEEARKSVIDDIENTLSRLQNALSHIKIDENEKEEIM